MQQIRIEKVTFNVGAGTDQKVLDKGIKLLKNLTGVEPVKTVTSKRIPTWGLRPGLPIGCKITIRGKKAVDILKRCMVAKENKLSKTCFDNHGNVSFGIHEYINIPDLGYDPTIGIMGFQLSATLMRPGYRVKLRRKLTKKLGKSKIISQDDSIKFFEENFKISVVK